MRRDSAMRKRTAAVCMIFMATFAFIIQPMTYAGLVDDWLTQKTETPAGYFEGQKRGYYTAGSFSARWPRGNDYLMTITPPKAKAGCGGIDAFMGGFSFLNMDYLVQKLQRMIQAAPAIAFDIALQVLTSNLPNSMKDFEKIINALNNVQLDECKAANKVVATLTTPGNEDEKSTLAKAWGEFKTETGLDNLWKSVQNAINANNNKPTGNEAGDPAAGNTAGCPDDVKAIFGETGSVIEKLGAKYGTSAYTDIIRGVIGDIYVQKYDDGRYKIAYKASCEQNEKFDIKKIQNGEIYAMNSSGVCYVTTDSKLIDWVTAKMGTIAAKYKTKTPFNADEEAFMNSNPLPLALVMKYATGTNQEGAVLGTLADITAKAYAYTIASEFYVKIITLLEKARQLYTSNKDAKPEAKAHQCQLELIENAPKMSEEMQQKTYQLVLGLRESYAALAKEISAVMMVTDKLQRFDEMAYKMLSDKFGKPVANRAVSK